jgi:hypothetical protein
LGRRGRQQRHPPATSKSSSFHSPEGRKATAQPNVEKHRLERHRASEPTYRHGHRSCVAARSCDAQTRSRAQFPPSSGPSRGDHPEVGHVHAAPGGRSSDHNRSGYDTMNGKPMSASGSWHMRWPSAPMVLGAIEPSPCLRRATTQRASNVRPIGLRNAGRDQAGRHLIVRHAAWRNTRRCLLDKTQSAAALFAVTKST